MSRHLQGGAHLVGRDPGLGLRHVLCPGICCHTVQDAIALGDGALPLGPLLLHEGCLLLEVGLAP
eukprot:7689183-Heterocapsa_arctica.AAC.1